MSGGALVLFVLLSARQTGTGGEVASMIGARDGRGLMGGARVLFALYGAGRGYMRVAARQAFTSKLCSCVTYDRSPQNSAATSFRYLFGVKCCYFVF